MFRSTERQLEKDPAKAKVYEAEIQKLIDGGCVTKLSEEEMDKFSESWFIPHHLVHHNGKDHLVFDCAFTYRGLSLNEQFLPGPTLGPLPSCDSGSLLSPSVEISGQCSIKFVSYRRTSHC